MPRAGIWTAFLGLLISLAATVLLFAHVTSEYNRQIQDMGSIAVAYLGLSVLGLTVSVTGVGLLVWAANRTGRGDDRSGAG